MKELSIELDEIDLVRLEQIANARGIDVAMLVKNILLEAMACCALGGAGAADGVMQERAAYCPGGPGGHGGQRDQSAQTDPDPHAATARLKARFAALMASSGI